MSETKIINRIQESFGQKIERERLEAETQAAESEGLAVAREEQIETLIAQVASNASAATTAKTVWDTPEGQKIIDEVLETAAQELGAAIPDDIGNRTEQASLMDVLKDYRTHGPRDPDLRDFRSQVIAAFKHLGLDTRKFFGV
jgi:hypothetical protein